MLNSGAESGAAFAAVFGASPGELWETVIEGYSRKPTIISRDFDAGILDIDFVASDDPGEELGPLLRYLADKADARRSGNPGLVGLDLLPGQWDQLRFEGQCSSPLTFRLREDADIIAIDGFYSAPDDVQIPALFAYERTGETAYRLTNVTADEYPNVVLTSDYRLTMRTDNVFCFDEYPGRVACRSVFHRCGRENASLD